MISETGSIAISIGLPVYNGEKYIRDAIESILAQTFTRYELIICDNASTDSTKDICLDYAQRFPQISYYRNLENYGAAFNYNRTFNLSRGEFFKWAAADDCIAPEFLQACLNMMVADSSIVLCYPQTRIIDEKGKVIGDYRDLMELTSTDALQRYREFHARFRVRDKCNAIFGLIRSSALRSTRLVDRFVSSDVILLAELALLGKFVEVNQPLFFRRYHDEMSIRAYKPADRAVWFDTRAVHKNYPAVNWKLAKEFYISVRRIKLKPAQKAGCVLEILRWMFWRRKLLVIEFRGWCNHKQKRMPLRVRKCMRFIFRWVHRVRKSPSANEETV